MVSPFILRRLKKDVLKDLPDKLEEIRYAKFDKQQQHVYDAQALNMINMLSGKDDESFRKDKKSEIKDTLVTNKLANDQNLSSKTWDKIRIEKYNLKIEDSELNKSYKKTIDSIK